MIALSEEREYWRLILTALSVLSILFALFMLKQQSWTKTSLSLYIIDHTVFGLAFLLMAYQGDLFVFLPEIEANAQEVQKLDWLREYFDNIVNWSLAITGIVAIASAASYSRLFAKLH